MVAAGSGPIRTLGALWASSLPSTSRPLVPVLFPRRGGVHTFSISSSFPLPTVTTVMGNPKCMETASPPHSRAPPRAPPNRRPTVATAAIAMTTNTTKYHAPLPVLNPATPVLPVQPPPSGAPAAAWPSHARLTTHPSHPPTLRQPGRINGVSHASLPSTCAPNHLGTRRQGAVPSTMMRVCV